MKEQILELRERGFSYSQIQKELGCSKSVISYHLGSGQKEKAYNRVKKQRQLYPWLHKQEHFVEKYKERNLTYNAVYFDRTKIKDYLDTIDRCYLSGRPIDTNNVKTYEFDHIHPLAKGGESVFKNLGIATPEANRAKADLTVDEFIQLCKDVLENFGYSVTK
jgi:DNA-binding CsgD family transcriptional regulator